jgi:uncharacterized Zn finger protein (UPF0148 family)
MNYDLSKFHPDCGPKQLMLGGDGMHIYCPVCQVSANVEAISAKISAVDACRAVSKDRVPIGKQTAGIDKGEVKA